MKTNSNNTSSPASKLLAAARLGAQRVHPLPDGALEGLDLRQWVSALVWASLAPLVPVGEERRYARRAVLLSDALLEALAAEPPSQAKPATLRLTGEPPFPPPPLVKPGPDPLPEDVFDLDSLERGGTDE